MITYCYDIESFKNLFTVTFINVDDEKDVHVFYTGIGKEDYSDLLKFLKQEMILVGYNNHSYDDCMLRFLMTYNGCKLTTDLYNLSMKLIDDNFRGDKQVLELRYPKKTLYLWRSIDLMKMLAFDKLGVSLKQVAINLKWHKIQDMPIHHETHVNVTQLDLVLDYNKNDVLITKCLYEEVAPLRALRDDLEKIYHVDFSSASKSKMANLILEYFYGTEMHVDIRTLRDMRTNREKVFLRNCIAPFVRFQSPELKEMLDRITATYVYEYNDFRYSENVYYANCNFALGIGGLHTVDEPGVFVSDDNYIIQDMDGSSYYPHLIINNNFYPDHLGSSFIKVLKRIVDERMAAKATGDKVKAEGLKITANSIFGKFRSMFFWLYDPKQLLSTTLSGQMGLLMLVEGMYMNGIEIISCNTDGIICKIPKEKIEAYYEVAREWEKLTGIALEFTRYKKYVRRDVNSYVAEKEDGETKEKGAFLKTVNLEKAYRMPIVGKALHNYFIKDIPVKDTLHACTDIMEFCISQKTGANFTMELHSGRKIDSLQKTNRYYISRKGGSLVKRDKTTRKMTGLNVGRMVRILNDFDPLIPFSDYNVDYSFYEKEVMKIVDEIEPKQLSLFDLSSLEKSHMAKAPVSAVEHVIDEEATVAELNRLGKNQLVRKLEYIINNNQKIGNISPRYVYVMDFNARDASADIYCLGKAIRQTISIDKTAYKKTGLTKGALVYCTKFEKSVLVDYKITSKIEEQKTPLI